MLGLSAGESIFYSLQGFSDPRPDKPVDGMDYQNYALQNCSVQLLEVAQIAVPTASVEVAILFILCELIKGVVNLQYIGKPIYRLVPVTGTIFRSTLQ